MGCNFKCTFCQNSSISQVLCNETVEGEKVTWDTVLDAAFRSNAKSIAYTYSEPTVFYEMVKGVGMPAKEKGLKNVIVSNGFMSDDAAEEMVSFIDGANIDLKFFDPETYRKYTNGNLEKVKSSIEIFADASSFWLEVTTLIIPGLNDSDEELQQIASWIASLDGNIPWHISRFFPHFKMKNINSTSPEILKKAYDIGKTAGLKYVYLGNFHDPAHEHTYCSVCGKAVIKRTGYWIDENSVSGGFCGHCGSEIAGVWT